MPKLLIIADDLTGAMDSGVQLAKQGVSTIVVPSATSWGRVPDCTVLVVNTESRHATPTAAADSVNCAVQLGRNLGVQHFYKKTDSTLRGNIGSELEALLRASGQRRLMFIPAFPRLGRTTHEGRQYVNGIALHQTEYAEDPFNPISTSDVPELIREQADVDAYSVGISQLRSLQAACPSGICVVDCGGEEDLRTIGDALGGTREAYALAGSAGFSEQLGTLFGLSRRSCKQEISLPPRMLAVNGSMNPAARRQVEQAREHGFAVVPIDAELLIRDGQEKAHSWDEMVGTVVRQARSASNVLLTPGASSSGADVAGKCRDAMLAFAENLGRFVATLVERAEVRLITVVGGDTLSAITRALQCDFMEPLQEILPGIALSKMHVCAGEMFVVSKAGGFGSDDVLPRICDALRRVHT